MRLGNWPHTTKPDSEYSLPCYAPGFVAMVVHRPEHVLRIVLVRRLSGDTALAEHVGLLSCSVLTHWAL